MEEADSDDKRILAQFKSENGDVTGNAFDLPLNVTAEKLQLICNALLTNVSVNVLLAETAALTPLHYLKTVLLNSQLKCD